jgi:hypothetical protein
MYTKTLRWLSEHPLTHSLDEWQTERNAILEVNLVHARILIEFMSKEFLREKSRLTDVYAVDYLGGNSSDFPITDSFLELQSGDIGGRLVHLTTKSSAVLKSHEDWDTQGIAEHLIPALNKFLDVVPDETFEAGVKSICKGFLSEISVKPDLLDIEIPGPMHPTT